jgi:hypothetical protein
MFAQDIRLLPEGVSLWDLDTMIEGGKRPCKSLESLINYAVSPGTYSIVGHNRNMRSKSARITVYGPVADFPGEPLSPRDGPEEQRVYVSDIVARRQVNALHYHAKKAFAKALLENVGAEFTAEDRYRLSIPVGDLLELFNLNGIRVD